MTELIIVKDEEQARKCGAIHKNTVIVVDENGLHWSLPVNEVESGMMGLDVYGVDEVGRPSPGRYFNAPWGGYYSPANSYTPGDRDTFREAWGDNVGVVLVKKEAA